MLLVKLLQKKEQEEEEHYQLKKHTLHLKEDYIMVDHQIKKLQKIDLKLKIEIRLE